MVIKDSKKARLDLDFGKTTIAMATINIMKTKGVERIHSPLTLHNVIFGPRCSRIYPHPPISVELLEEDVCRCSQSFSMACSAISHQ
jgi:hypothetical protein